MDIRTGGPGGRDTDGGMHMKEFIPITITLEKPVTYCDEDFSELTLDFSGLTGKDDLNIRSRMEKELGRVPVALEGNTEYASRVAAKAAKIDPDVFDVIGASDMLYILDVVNDYLDTCSFQDKVLTCAGEDLTVDFDALTGKDVLDAERACGAARTDKKADVPFLSALAAKAAGMTPAAVKELPLCDHAALILLARNFLIVSAFKNRLRKTQRVSGQTKTR